MNLKQLYEKRCAAPSDICELLPALAELAAECQAIAEFGVRRGHSTVALLYGLSETGGGILHSFDRDQPATKDEIDGAIIFSEIDPIWLFTQTDTSTVEIPEVDLLFVDTLHTYEQVRAEIRPDVLKNVHQYIAFHDTELFGWRDEGREDAGPGIMPAILERLAEDGGWILHSYTRICNGLTVFERV